MQFQRRFEMIVPSCKKCSNFSDCAELMTFPPGVTKKLIKNYELIEDFLKKNAEFCDNFDSEQPSKDLERQVIRICLSCYRFPVCKKISSHEEKRKVLEDGGLLTFYLRRAKSCEDWKEDPRVKQIREQGDKPKLSYSEYFAQKVDT